MVQALSPAAARLGRSYGGVGLPVWELRFIGDDLGLGFHPLFEKEVIVTAMYWVIWFHVDKCLRVYDLEMFR
jgi:hypothetical protein